MTQRFVDAWMAFPGLLLLLTIMSIAGRGMLQIIVDAATGVWRHPGLASRRSNAVHTVTR